MAHTLTAGTDAGISKRQLFARVAAALLASPLVAGTSLPAEAASLWGIGRIATAPGPRYLEDDAAAAVEQALVTAVPKKKVRFACHS